MPEPTVVVITGPIASGKSTVARAVAGELERVGTRVAVIDLDLIHELLPADGSASSDATWQHARREAATSANGFLADGLTVVVAEGSFNAPADRAAFAERLEPGAAVLYVTLEVSFDEALRRAQGDPTRAKSRDPVFLRRYFAAGGHGLDATPRTDLVIDTERLSAAAAAALVLSLFGGAASR